MKRGVLGDRTMHDIQVIGQNFVFVVSICLLLVVFDDGLDVRLSLFLGEFVPVNPGKQILRGLFEIGQILEVEVFVVLFDKFLFGVVHVFVDIDQVSGIVAVLLELIDRFLTSGREDLSDVGDAFFSNLSLQASMVVLQGVDVGIVALTDLDVVRAGYYVHHSHLLN